MGLRRLRIYGFEGSWDLVPDLYDPQLGLCRLPKRLQV